MARLVSLGLTISLVSLTACDGWIQDRNSGDSATDSALPTSPTESDSSTDTGEDNSEEPSSSDAGGGSENSDNNSGDNSAPQRPEFSSEQIEIEGQPTELTLKLFTEPELPYSTYVPIDEFVTDIQETDQVTVVTHYANFGGTLNENAYIRMVLPKRPTTVEALQEQILGEEGLLASQSWQITDRTDVVVWPWAREYIHYLSSDADENSAGEILIGEHEGQGFYILSHYPIEYTEGFEPRAMVLINELQFKNSQG
ncbi:MAG: hypothetical protein ACTS2F_15360 [Thainema sp.]